MAKYKDRFKVGSSTVVPYDPRLSNRARHDTRLEVALQFQETAREWCNLHGITLRVTNGGHHWQFTLRERIAEWWPSSAKMVFQKHWRKGFHVHDWLQASRLIAEKFGIRA